MNKIIAIDGPSGSGKGTVANLLSEKLNLVYIDTGAMYRCVALSAIRNNLSIEDTEEIIKLSKNIDIKLTRDGKVFLDNEDVTNEIRNKEVTNIVSQISSIVKVRENMVNLQRRMTKNQDIVMEGRDITTVVFPNAEYKFYLDASIEERAKRRYKESKEKNIDITYNEVYENIKMRDYNDMHKKVGSLIRTDDQIYIDTTSMSIDEVVNIIIKDIEKRN